MENTLAIIRNEHRQENRVLFEHFDKAMIEYPSGCILALKEVHDPRLIVPGENYVIETSEYTIARKILISEDQDYITAYSTNTQTHPDGRPVHGPFNIPLDAIRRIFKILGYAVKSVS
jgi:hypothetical protein